MIILVLNCGSSSIKYQVIDMTGGEDKLLAIGLIERIGMADAVFKHKPEGKEKVELIQNIADHSAGISMIVKMITDKDHGVIESLNDLGAVGHRVAHGGEFFSGSAVVDQTVIKEIENLFDLAPLHNPANLKGILSIQHILPNTPQVAVFDTSFHQTIPAKNYLYALPYKYYEDYKVRKYGFHGTSHRFVAQQGAALAGLDFENSKIITCHIGNGASITAIKDGKSYDTSMGFTPVDGLVMGTRCGEVDPGALLFIAKKEEFGNSRMNDIINKESGVLGISGISSDMRDIEDAAWNKGHERALLALDIYCNRMKKYIGSYAAQMGGVDLVVFTGGVGENGPEVREDVLKNMEYMGLEFDLDANKCRGKNALISAASSKVKAAVICTNEELVIATDTFNLVKKRSE